MEEQIVAQIINPAVGWLSLSLIISGLAQALNRDGLGWWLFAIITGPFALFFLVILGKYIPENNNEKSEESEKSEKQISVLK